MKRKHLLSLITLLLVSSTVIAQTTVSQYFLNSESEFLTDAVGSNALINGNGVLLTDGISGSGAALFTGDSAFLETDPLDIIVEQASFGVEMLVRIDATHDAMTNESGIMTLIGQWGVGSNRTFRVNVAWDETQQASAIKFAIRLRNNSQFFDGSDDESIPEEKRIYLENDIVYYLGCFLDNTGSNETDSIRFFVKDLTNGGPLRTAAVQRGIFKFEEDTNVDEPIRIGRSGDEFFQFKGIIDNVRLTVGDVDTGVINPLLTTTEWNGTRWSNDEPIDGFDAIISADYTTADNGSFSTSSLSIDANTSIAEGDFIAVNDLLTNNSTLNVVSGGSLVTSGALAGAGSYNFEREITSKSSTSIYNALGSPISGSNVSDLGNFVWEFTEATSGDTEKFTNPTGILAPGRGYFSDFIGTLSFTGTPNNGDVSVPVTNSQDGFNLVSNPYPCVISYTDLVESNSSVISGAIYLLSDDKSTDGESPSQVDFFTVSSLGNVNGSSNNTQIENELGPMQAFFVKANAPGNVVFSDELKVADNSDGSGQFQTVSENDFNAIKLAISNSSDYDETLVAVFAEASAGVDPLLDAHKFKSTGPEIYSKIDDESFAIQAISDVVEVPLFIDIDAQGEYTLTVLSNTLSETVFLVDNLDNQIFTLEVNSTITFNSEAVVDENRFSLVADPAVLVSEIDISSSAGNTITVGQTSQMSAVVLPADATDATFAWNVVNGTGEATINQTGLFTAISEGTVTVQAIANDDSGITGALEITIEEIISSLVGKVNLNIYPNPFKDKLRLDNYRSNTVEIIDPLGRRFSRKVVNNAIDLSDLKQGIYLIRPLESSDMIRAIKQ